MCVCVHLPFLGGGFLYYNTLQKNGYLSTGGPSGLICTNHSCRSSPIGACQTGIPASVRFSARSRRSWWMPCKRATPWRPPLGLRRGARRVFFCPPTAESFGVSAHIGSGVVRGGPEIRFHEGSTRSTVPQGSARAAGWCEHTHAVGDITYVFMFHQ